MPKIPTFEADLLPTAEVGAVKSSLQVSPKDTLAGTLLPAAQDITNYYIKEKEISNKIKIKTVKYVDEILSETLENKIEPLIDIKPEISQKIKNDQIEPSPQTH